MKKFIAIVIVSVAVIGLFALTAECLKTPEPVGYEVVIVQKGDTLWGIGAEYCNKWNCIDNQTIVSMMREKSNCSSNIQPGQRIYVPIFED